MALFKAFNPKVEVNGQTVLAIVAGMGAFRDTALNILAQCGLPDPQPGQWYLQQAWLDAFKQISDTVGASTLNLIGREIPRQADFPPEIDSLPVALAAIDKAYHMNHRGGEIGNYAFTMDSDGHGGTMVCHNPYPCDFDLGIIQSMCRLFRGTSVTTIAHDANQPCRKRGDDYCLYRVTWT